MHILSIGCHHLNLTAWLPSVSKCPIPTFLNVQLVTKKGKYGKGGGLQGLGGC